MQHICLGGVRHAEREMILELPHPSRLPPLIGMCIGQCWPLPCSLHRQPLRLVQLLAAAFHTGGTIGTDGSLESQFRRDSVCAQRYSLRDFCQGLQLDRGTDHRQH